MATALNSVKHGAQLKREEKYIFSFSQGLKGHHSKYVHGDFVQPGSENWAPYYDDGGKDKEKGT